MSLATNYAAVLAKIGAEKSRLLSEVKVKALAETKNLAAFASQLRDTTYQTQIARVPLPLSSRKLERAFNENLIDSHVKMIKNSPATAGSFLSVYVLRFEVENLKTLIKSINAGLGTEDKLGRIYLSAEDFLKRRSIFEDAAKASNLKQMQNLLKCGLYTAALSKGMQAYEENGSTAALDILLDKVFYDQLRESYEALPSKQRLHVKFYAATENDGFTILAILRGKLLNYDAAWLRGAIPPKYFQLSLDAVDAMLNAADFESAFKIASETHYGKLLAKAASPEEVLAAAEKAFKRTVYQHAKAATIGEIFNVGAPLAFMMLKETEVRNLIAASAGIESEVGADGILSQMML